MSIAPTRRCLVVLAAAAALLLAGLAASQADAATLYACVKKNGNSRLFSNKPKCKKGEKKLTWNIEGMTGRNGTNGLNGANGANGKDGAQGKEGPAGPFGETLPSGKSETGVYAIEGSGSVIQSGWGFPFALATAPTSHFILDGATPPAQCPGSLSNPRASPGHLCVYESKKHGGTTTFKEIFNPENEGFGTSSRFGFGIDLDNSKAPENAWSQGTWAVTAP
jgi:hypothetical protein